MKKRAIYSAILVIGFALTANASHITGGEMHYIFTGTANGRYYYSVSLKLFQRCLSGRQFPNPCLISVFDKTDGTRLFDMDVLLGHTENISIGNSNPCISNPPSVCYDVAYYNFDIVVPRSAQGFVIATQVNFRIDGITNLLPGSSSIGATYIAEIPGFAQIPTAPQNSSANFLGSDLVIVCANNDFSYSFAAGDPDGDVLRYTFCEAYGSTNGNTLPPNPPPYPSVPYNFPSFGPGSPLGLRVQLDPSTGLIRGTAPAQGIYVVTVCAQEIRNGVLIATQRKDLQIFIADCSIAAASLLPSYQVCGNTNTLTVANQSNSPLIVSYNWQFLNGNGNVLYSASGPSATYTFPDTGVYAIKLAINKNQPCSDSTESQVKVYPGFNPDFAAAGACITKPTRFTDRSTSVYGTVNSWAWDFGDQFSTTDFALTQNATYTYPTMGTREVRLTVTDTKGCLSTLSKLISVLDKPPLLLKFADTLICLNDQVQLVAGASGTFSWSPPGNISNSNSATPTVDPNATTTYYVDLDDNGCINRDSVKVRVVDHVNLQVMNDTTICQGDTVRLTIVSDALQYNWTPASQFIDPLMQNPSVTTNNSTNYQVRAIIGGCTAQDNIVVTTIPYPTAFAGTDTTICYNTSALLNAVSNGSSWNWSPPVNLTDPLSLHPIASPPGSLSYIFTAFDTKGCPKPGRDTVVVFVEPKMNPFAGNDTSVVMGQPLQLNASGGEFYSWTPSTYLSATTIPDPVALFNIASDDLTYKVVMSTPSGCLDSAFISIKVFATPPTVFVPSAFTPNADGHNDILRPIAVGISRIEMFQVFNRWGQLVFTTNVNGQGWDGKISGLVQPTGTFVWMVKANDYTGASYFQRGTVTLIR